MMDAQSDEKGCLKEEDKQIILVEFLDNAYKNFLMEYDLSRVSVMGCLQVFKDNLRAEWQEQDDDEDDDD